MKKLEENDLTIREKVVIVLVVFLIQMIKPWEYDHQFKKFWDELKDLMTTHYVVEDKTILG